jgi:PhnB protein
MYVQPYLFFNGRCEEAIQFYKTAVGAELQMMMRHKDNPTPPQDSSSQGCRLPAGSEEKVMHASFRIGETVVMASDGMCSGEPSFDGFSLSVSLAGEAEAKAAFAKLSEGGKINMPVSKTFWSPAFGMLVDRFGVSWMITVQS